MAEAISEARRILENRLSEVENEASGLRRAIASLPGTTTELKTPPPKARPARTRTASTRTASSSARNAARRAPKGRREEQLFKSISAHPNQKVADYARRVGVRPQQLYPLLRRLEEAGRIKKTKDGYKAKS
jgi:predicted Rossmann fold nucleotide-binding protein DprA/Smf involved in DNA uptake